MKFNSNKIKINFKTIIIFKNKINKIKNRNKTKNNK